MATLIAPMETYQVIVHRAEEGGFWGEVVGLPGCVSQGDSMEEFNKNIREAIQAVLQNEADATIRLLREPPVSSKDTFFFMRDIQTGRRLRTPSRRGALTLGTFTA